MDSIDIRLRPCGADGDDPELLDIYHRSFPIREQKTDREIRAMMANPNYRFLMAYDRNRLIGFSSTVLVSEHAALLEYMAVDDTHQSKGIGGELFQQVKKDVGDGRVLVMEVDKGGISPEEIHKNARRQAFYRRHGCRLARDFPYIMPLGGAGGTAMDIMLWQSPDRSSVKKEELFSWISAIYSGAYGISNSDVRLNAMFGDLEDVIFLNGA